MSNIPNLKDRIEIYQSMISGGHVSTKWAIKNILNIGKEEFRKIKIKKIFNG
jgi:hypothetical protein